MSTIGATLSVKGEVRSSDDLTIAGRVDGDVICEGSAVTLVATCEITGDVIARDVTIFGAARGQIVATDVVDVRAEADVTGQIVSARLILHDGARFSGTVAPQHLEAALRVARFNRDKAASATPGPVAPQAAPARRAP